MYLYTKVRYFCCAGQTQQQTAKCLGKFSVEELEEWLKPILKERNISSSVLDIFRDQEVDGEVFENLTDSELEKLCPDLKFGPRKKILHARDQCLHGECHDTFQESPASEGQARQRTEYARGFGCVPDISEFYHVGRILNKHEERAGNLINPVRKFLPCTYDNLVYEHIADEVTIFGSACLNDRTNGIIYFGIGDVACESYAYGEVLGVVLDKKECEDAVRLSIMRRFSEDMIEIVQKCIKPPVFVPVVGVDDEDRFVCEVDIEPRSDWIKQDHAFFVKSKLDASRSELILYRLSGGVPKSQDVRQVEKFSTEKVQLSKDRQQQEKQSERRELPSLVAKLGQYMFGGENMLDGNFYPILATTKINIEDPEFSQSFQFLFKLEFRCVLDFDPSSDKRGLYYYAEHKEEKVYLLKTTDDFLNDSLSGEQPNQRSPQETFDEMMESRHNSWIFCNGLEAENDRGFDVLQWKEEKSGGYKETVRFLQQSIPEDRAVVLILVTSDDDVFIDASEELLLRFKNQWVMISQSKKLADAWIEGLQRRNVRVDKNRCICDFLLTDVNKAIAQLLRSENLKEDICLVNTSTGVHEEVSKKLQQQLCDLDIVSAKQCSHLEAAEIDLSRLSKEAEEQFFKGNSASWLNFYFKTHVCPRNLYNVLLKNVREMLKGEDAPDNANVGRVAVYHQAGAGGTTVAMNVLWDLKAEYKCCRIKQIARETARQILKLYEHGESNPDHHIKPVLVMLDNEDDENVNSLQRDLEEECDLRSIQNIVCVFLVCTQRMMLPSEPEVRNIFLNQKLSFSERQFFLDKYAELQKQYKNNKDRVNPDSLLGLNIMKEDFNEDYIRRTVKTILEATKDEKVRVAVKYTALLNMYDVSFRGIPVPCFDKLMHRRNWENDLKSLPLLTYTSFTDNKGQYKRLRISCKLLCKYILDIGANERYCHGELMEEFMNSTVFRRAIDFAQKKLLEILNEIMKKREWTDSRVRSKFSPFIQMLFDAKRFTQATQCMIMVYEHSEDPVLAQQLARFYISCKNWDEAEKWAETAVKQRWLSSFLWDTRGQVFKFQLHEMRDECEQSHGAVDQLMVDKAVKCAEKGFKVFQQVVEMSKKERSVPPNMAGYFGQMDVITALLKIMKHSAVFRSEATFQKFFIDDSFVPEELVSDKKCIPWLKSLQRCFTDCLRSVEDAGALYSEYLLSNSLSKIFLSESHLGRYRTILSKLFSENDNFDSDPMGMNPERRRTAVRKLGGHSLYSVTQLYSERQNEENVKKILTLASANLQGSTTNAFDLNMALASYLCLCSHEGTVLPTDIPFTDLLKWSKELVSKRQNQQHQRYIDLDPFLYLLLFHWPTENRQNLQHQAEIDMLSKTAQQAKEFFQKKYAKLEGQKKNTPLYFLTKHPAERSIVCKEQLYQWAGNQRRFNLAKLVKSPKAVDNLKRFSGRLDRNGMSITVTITTSEGNKADLNVALFKKETRQSLVRKRVFFVLGFGLGGPVACDIDLELPRPLSFHQRTAVLPKTSRSFLPDQLLQVDQEIEEVVRQLNSTESFQKETKDQVRYQLTNSFINLSPSKGYFYRYF